MASHKDSLEMLLYILSDAFKIALFPVAAYYLFIAVTGWFCKKGPSSGEYRPKHTFAFVIAAHNEERVIGNLVSNLLTLNYPREMYAVFVVADHCTDRTAEIAEEGGARVFRRFNGAGRGKGYALEWMFRQLFKEKRRFDAVCVLDADNLVSPNYLQEMNQEMCKGSRIIQGYLDSKNPLDSWVAGCSAINFWLFNRTIQWPRYRLGLSCTLLGTGFVIASDILQSAGWGTTSLTEDLEFTLNLVLRNQKVGWCHGAVVYDEKPLDMGQSWQQRKRWMQGQADCTFGYIGRLLKKALVERDIVAFDSVLYLLQPLAILVNTAGAIVGFFTLLVSTDGLGLFSVNAILALLLYLLTSYGFLLFLLKEKKLSSKKAWYYLIFPLFNLTWIPIILQGLFDRKKREWVHTLHTRSIGIAEIET